MNTDGGQQNFNVSLTTEQLRRDAQNAMNQFTRIGNHAIQQGHRIDLQFNQVGNTLSSSVKKGVDGAKSAIADLSKNILGISALMASGSFIKDVYSSVGEFNKQMRIVSTISDEVTKDMDNYKENVLNMCTQLAIVPETAAAALYQINSAGHLGANGMKVLEVSAKASIGGITETAVAADAITTILNAYKKKSEEAEAVSDKLFTTVRLGKTTMDELGRSIAYVAPMAATYKISIDEVLAAVAQLTKQGNSTQNAVTQISASIVAVANEMGDDAFKDGLLPALEEIEKRSNGSNLALKAQLSNIRAVRGALGLTKENAAETAQMIDEIKNSAGAADTACKKMNTTSGAELTKLKNNFIKEFSEIATGGKSLMGDLAKALNDAFDTGRMQDFLSILGLVIAAYGTSKAILMSMATIERANQAAILEAEYAAYMQLLPAKEADANADIRAAIASGALTEAKGAELIAIREELAQSIASAQAKQTLAAQELASAEAAVAASNAKLAAAELEVEMWNRNMLTAQAYCMVEEERQAIQKLGNAVDVQQAASIEANTAAKRLASAQSQMSAASQELETLTHRQNMMAIGGEMAATGGLAMAKKALTMAAAKLNAVLLANPYTIAAAGAIALGVAIYKLCTYESEHEKSMKRVYEATSKINESTTEEIKKIDALRDILQTAQKGTEAWNKAKEEVVKQYGKYLPELDAEIEKTGSLASVYDRLTEAIQRSIRLKGLSDYAQQNSKEGEIQGKLTKFYKDVAENGRLGESFADKIISKVNAAAKEGESGWRQWFSAKELRVINDENLAKDIDEMVKIRKNEKSELDYFMKANKLSREDYTEALTGIAPPKESENKVPTYKSTKQEAMEMIAQAAKATKASEISTLKDKMKDMLDKGDIEVGSREYNQLKQAYDKLKSRTSESDSKTIDKRGDAQQKLNRELEAYESETQQAQTALMDEGREKRLKIIEDEYKDRLSQIKRQREDWAKENQEAGVKGVGADGLTAEQSKALADRERTAIDQKKKDTAEALKEELSAMRAYLTEYGSIEQQKLAITEEYEQKIRDAKTDGEKLSLAKERDSRLAESNLNAITLGIDWNALFSGVGNLSQKMVDPMLKQLQAYVQTDAYKNAGAENQQKVTELIDELRRFSPSFKPETWQELATATANFVEATRSHAQLVEREKDAYSDLEKAKTQLDKGEITQQEYDRIKKSAEDLSLQIVESEKSVRSFGTTLNGVSDSIASGANELTAALNNAKGWKGLDGFSGVQGANDALGAWQADLKNVLAGMQGESLGKTIGKQLSSTVSNALGGMTSGMESILSSGMGSMVGIVAQLPSLILNIVGSIKNMITGALDSLSTLVSFRWVDDLIVGILDSIGNLIDTIFDLPENLYHVFEAVIVDGIGGLLNTIIGRIGNILSFGALSSKGPADWFTNSNSKWVAETTERLTKSNEKLRDSVDRLKDEMSGSYGGWKAIDAARRAKDDQQKINDQTMEILIAQMRYHGDHGSNASKWNLGKKDYASLNETLADYAKKYGKGAKKVNSLADIFGLTPEEMDYIRKHNTTMWSVMLTRGKYDKSQYWEDYADLAGAMDEITDKLKESLTQTTFDSFRGSFVDSLMDMTKDAEAFGEDFTEIMMRSMLNAKISDLLDDQIKAFYDKWAEYAESDSTLTDAEMKELQAMWDAITQQGLDIRDSLAAATGYDKTSANQQGSTGGYKTELSEDTGTLISGRLTALQIAAEKRNTTLESINLDLKAVKERQEQSRDGINEIRDLMYVSIEHLENIEKNTNHLKQMNERLGKIEQNTRNL